MRASRAQAKGQHEYAATAEPPGLDHHHHTVRPGSSGDHSDTQNVLS
jgi:hypothetical protein